MNTHIDNPLHGIHFNGFLIAIQHRPKVCELAGRSFYRLFPMNSVKMSDNVKFTSYCRAFGLPRLSQSRET